MLIQLDPGRHLLMARRASRMQVLLQLAMAHRGAVQSPVRRVHVAHGAVEVARGLRPGAAVALHFADLGEGRGYILEAGVYRAMLEQVMVKVSV